MEWKKKIVGELREAAETYNGIYVLRVYGMRSPGLKELRKAWRDSKLFLGKNKVMALALGKTPESEVQPNAHKICSRLEGDSGLLFTDKSEEEVRSYFDKFVEKDFARGGSIATDTVELPEGPLDQFPHSIEPHLRSLGLPTALKRGVVTLIKDYTVCKKGETLNVEQAKLLKLLLIPMSEFRLVIDSVWTKPDEFKIVRPPQDLTDSSYVSGEEMDEDEEKAEGDEDDEELVELDSDVEVLGEDGGDTDESDD